MSLPIRAPCEEISSDSHPGALHSCSGPWVLIATILASSMAFIDGTVVNVALPALQTALHATVADIQWVVESYALLLASLLLLGGSLGDLYGRRKVFASGVVLFALGSALCGSAPSMTWLIAARGLQGVGAAFLIPGSLAIISASYSKQERGRAIGTWSGFTAMTDCSRSSAWGMACHEIFMALGFLYQSSPRDRHHFSNVVASPGEPQ